MTSDMRDAECKFCAEKVWDKPWSLHEVQPDVWLIVCEECADATGLYEGK